MRSLLTSLGIIIGVGAVIVMVAIGQGAQARIANQINSLGANLIIISPGFSRYGGVSRGAGSSNRLTLEDVEKLKSGTALLNGISPIVQVRAQAVVGNSNWYTSIVGASADYLVIRNWSIASGEFFTEREIRNKSKVAILGKVVADNLFLDQDPIGQQVRIRNTPFKVIGVLTEKGQSAMGQDQDDVILAPATTVLYRLSGGRYINMILASAKSVDQVPAAQQEIADILHEVHRSTSADQEDFNIGSQAEIIERASATARVLTLLLGSIAGVSLIVGGIGIMNIMLVSVTERTREIGIRLAVGARASDILTQFLLEAVVLSLVGGLIGILLAFGVSFALNRLTEVATLINPGIVVLAVAFAGAVGIFFGFYPARKAAELNPIDALRYE